MLAALIVPLLQLLCVILLEIGHEGKTDISVLILNFLKNPILLASAAGFALQALPKMPVQVQDALHDISQCATPLSFIVLGGMFSIDAIKKNINNLIYGITGKLIVVPAIMLPIAYQFGFRGPELIALVSLFTAPVAINVFNFAKAMNADVELAGQFVVLSSLFSIATVFFWIFFLNQFNMI
jgi:predicted permease